ncbi:hypothetical protein M432DRAFT_601280, partial [Thermoascus aurantiacus ATCC 26904]
MLHLGYARYVFIFHGKIANIIFSFSLTSTTAFKTCVMYLPFLGYCSPVALAGAIPISPVSSGEDLPGVGYNHSSAGKRYH